MGYSLSTFYSAPDIGQTFQTKCRIQLLLTVRGMDKYVCQIIRIQYQPGHFTYTINYTRSIFNLDNGTVITSIRIYYQVLL